MTPLFRKILGLNWVIVVTMMGLLIFGVFAIYSASWMRSSPGIVNSPYNQSDNIGVGLVVFFLTSIIDYRWILWLAAPAYVASSSWLWCDSLARPNLAP